MPLGSNIICRRPAFALAAIIAATCVLGGCGGGARVQGESPGAAGPGPLQLGRGLRPGAERATVLRQVDEAGVRRAIENYRINKKRAAGPVQIVGADLNEDGTAEAIVLFAGKDWCTKTGCSLAIFHAGQRGYRVISRTVRVKAPVVISTGQSNGWRDLLVSTGGAGTAPLRRVRLRFNGESYARNAMLEEEIPPDVPQIGDVAIQAPPASPG
jgi:hypothetical protein